MSEEFVEISAGQEFYDRTVEIVDEWLDDALKMFGGEEHATERGMVAVNRAQVMKADRGQVDAFVGEFLMNAIHFLQDDGVFPFSTLWYTSVYNMVTLALKGVLWGQVGQVEQEVVDDLRATVVEGTDAMMLSVQEMIFSDEDPVLIEEDEYDE